MSKIQRDEYMYRYLHDEHQHKKSEPFDSTGWRMVGNERHTPQQRNGHDCGVFTSIFADFISRNQVQNVLRHRDRHSIVVSSTFSCLFIFPSS